MSSPIHHAQDLDAALMYAPPWARGGARPMPTAGAPPIDAAPGRWRGDNADDVFSGDLAMTVLQRQLALGAEEIPQPPRHIAGPHHVVPIALRMCAVAGVAAATAWAAISLPSVTLLGSASVSANGPATTIKTNRDAQDSLRSPTGAQQLIRHGLAEANVVQPPAEVQPVLALQATPSQPSLVLQPAPLQLDSDRPPQAAKPLQLEGDEIATLVKRGQDLLKQGDLSSARLLLRRAAEAGNANAALALGATFDPFVIQRLGAVGAEPDTAQARKWYEKAVELGSEAATQPLARLAQAP